MSVTAVPLQPVKRSYIVWICVGIAIAVAAAFLLARQGDDFWATSQRDWSLQTTPSGLKYEILKKANGGSRPTDSDVALVGYEGRLRNGKTFDKAPQVPMPVKGVVPGFSEALKLMHKGDKIRVWIPAQLGYGAEEKKDQQGNVVIPANSPLVFDVELIDFISEAQYQQMMMQQQMMNGGGMPGGAGGAPGGPGSGPGGVPGESVVPPAGK